MDLAVWEILIKKSMMLRLTVISFFCLQMKFAPATHTHPAPALAPAAPTRQDKDAEVATQQESQLLSQLNLLPHDVVMRLLQARVDNDSLQHVSLSATFIDVHDIMSMCYIPCVTFYQSACIGMLTPCPLSSTRVK